MSSPENLHQPILLCLAPISVHFCFHLWEYNDPLEECKKRKSLREHGGIYICRVAPSGIDGSVKLINVASPTQPKPASVSLDVSPAALQLLCPPARWSRRTAQATVENT